MKVFISHKNEDSSTAKEIKDVLSINGISAYLDILDNYNNELKGKELTEHIREKMNDCTDLLVVISEKTKESWWVPFEIGMASQNDFPIVNYLRAGIRLPDYLEYWPRLKNTTDIIKYISVKKKMYDRILEKMTFASTKTVSTERFYQELKSDLLR